MKKTRTFLVAADIHGSLQAFEQTLELMRDYKADKLILLGDIFGIDADEMVNKLNEISDKITVIKGNNDWYYEPTFADFEIYDQAYENLNGRIAYLCHGHRLNDMNLGQYNASVILQGHVHRPFIYKEQGVIRVCPGSIAVPRSGTEKSFALIDDEKIQILSTYGKVIMETAY